MKHYVSDHCTPKDKVIDSLHSFGAYKIITFLFLWIGLGLMALFSGDAYLDMVPHVVYILFFIESALMVATLSFIKADRNELLFLFFLFLWTIELRIILMSIYLYRYRTIFIW